VLTGGRLLRGRTALVARSALVVAVVVAAHACGPDDNEDAEPTQTLGSGPDLSHADLWLSFDEPAGTAGLVTYSDAAGGPSVGRLVSANGGQLEQVEGASGTGAAVAFPAKCTQDAGCPRAMVEVDHVPELDPVDRPFSFGATVWLAPDQTTTGSNILQKGRFGTEGGQWKLQVDTDQGEPSCVVRGDSPGAEPLVVRSQVSISDSEWHQVICRRDADGISISVDGTVDEKPGQTGSVTNDWPLRIGAPGVNEGDDQFHGRVDDVFVLVDPES
jgi:hypothetical protein